MLAIWLKDTPEHPQMDSVQASKKRMALAAVAVSSANGGKSTGPPKGSQNAFKHGRYTAKAKEEGRRLRATLLTIRQMLKSTGWLQGRSKSSGVQCLRCESIPWHALAFLSE